MEGAGILDPGADQVPIGGSDPVRETREVCPIFMGQPGTRGLVGTPSVRSS
jgi:hypothetical protein